MVILFCFVGAAVCYGLPWLALLLPWMAIYLWRLWRRHFSWQWQQIFEFGDGPWTLARGTAAADLISHIRVDRVWPRLVLLEVKIAGHWQWLVISADRTRDGDALRHLRILLREVYTGREYSVEGTGQ